MTRALALGLLLPLAAGCTTVASTAYSSATEERTVAEQASDTRISTAVRKRVLDVDSKSAVTLDVFTHLGQVVIAGVAPPESPIRQQAPGLARGVEGVKRVDTYWVAAQPSKTSDYTITAKLKAKIVGDGDLKASQVDFTVLGGHVVLTGLVDRQAKVDEIVRHARSIEGVVAVRSFVLVRPAK